MLTTEEEIYLAILIGVSSLTILLIFFIINLMYNQRKIRKLQKSLISAEIITLENERKRFSQDLHDEIGPMLSTVLLYANIIETKNKESEEIRLKAENVITETLSQVRSISRNITPKYIQEQGLKKSLESLIDNFNLGLKDKTTIKLNIGSIPQDLNEYENLNLYRIIQESINNAIRHAQASEIRVELVSENNHIHVSISDNGVGFEYTPMQISGGNSSGIGLKNLQNRVIFLGGQLDIYSHQGKGTQVVAKIPFA